MKKALLSVVVLILILISGFIGLTIGKKTSKKTDTQEIRFKPLEKYTIENLSQTDIKPGKLEIKDVMEEGENYVSYLFQLTFNPNLDGKTFISWVELLPYLPVFFFEEILVWNSPSSLR